MSFSGCGWIFLLATLVGLGSETCSGQQFQRPSIQKVEPPFWWSNHAYKSIRLLIRGEHLQNAKVLSSRQGLETKDTKVSPNGHWLFVTLEIAPNAETGGYPLTIKTPGGQTAVSFDLRPLDLGTKGWQGIDSTDVVQLIMPDRFCDGNPKNNEPTKTDQRANDRRNPRSFHGGDLQGIIQSLPYFKALGITAIWLNPWYENSNAVVDQGKPWHPCTSYHGYHPIDFYGVEDHFGDLATLQELASQAHAQGIKIIQDQVSNHIGFDHPWRTDPPLPDWINGTTDKHLHNDFRVDRLIDPKTPNHRREPSINGWFADDLPDLNQNQPEVARYLIQNALWWIGVAKLDGVREDTVPYLPRTYLRDLCETIHQCYPRVTVVGEVLDYNPRHSAFYQGGRTGWDGVDTKLDSVFDFPLWATSVNAFSKPPKVALSALSQKFASDSLYPNPRKLFTLSNNHDLKRFLSFPNTTIQGHRLHLAFLLTSRGIPQLYYGDEIGLPGGDDPDNRRDFPIAAFQAQGRSAEQQATHEWTRTWIQIRKQHPAISQGDRVEIFANNQNLAFAVRHPQETLVLVFSVGDQPSEITLPRSKLAAKPHAKLIPKHGPSQIVSTTDQHWKIQAQPWSATIFLITP